MSSPRRLASSRPASLERTFTRLKGYLPALVLVFATSLNVHAETLTFQFNGGDDGLSTISKTLSGITLTLSNPNPRTTFKADSDGIAVGLEGVSFLTGADLTSFELTVLGGSLAFKDYTLGYSARAESATFSMSGGTGDSDGNLLSAAGTYAAAGNWVLAPGDTGTLTAAGFDAVGLAQFESMTFEVVPVPEPSTYAMALAGLACGGYSVFRRRKRD